MSSLQVFSAAQRQQIAERDRIGVSVCVPCYEHAEYLQTCLDSLKNQTHEVGEIIIIDDGSPYQGEQIRILANEYGARYVRITNRGLPSARNTGIMLAKYAAFLPLDADDWIDHQYIEKTLPLLADADVVLTGIQEHGPTRNGDYRPGYDRHYTKVDEEILWQYNRFFYCSLFRTELLREVGGYHPKMAGWPGIHGGYEDWDLWIDLKRRDVRFAAIDEPLFNYRTKANSMLAKAESNRPQLVEEMRRHHGIA